MKNNYNVLEYYNNNAKLYFDQTLIADMQDKYDRFLRYLKKNDYILDFGCGSGRDSKYFIDNGYKIDAIDGSIEMCKLASKYIGQNVRCIRFNELNIKEMYDGIWACSSILHLEDDELVTVLKKMIDALKVGGVIYTCFKIGSGFEIKEGKYYRFLTKNDMQELLNNIDRSVELIDYFENFPSTMRNQKDVIWGNYIIKKNKK